MWISLFSKSILYTHLIRCDSSSAKKRYDHRVSFPRLPSQQYSDKDPTILIVTCIAAVKLLKLIESRSCYRNNETRSDSRRTSAFPDGSWQPRECAENHDTCFGSTLIDLSRLTLKLHHASRYFYHHIRRELFYLVESII